MGNKKSLILLGVIVSCIIVAAVTLATFYYYTGKMRRLGLYEERLRGYYLCEVGASKAIDVVKGASPPALPHTATITFNLDGTNYTVNYKIEGSADTPEILSWVTLSSGLTYKLELEGRRLQWPLFIKGILPPLVEDSGIP